MQSTFIGFNAAGIKYEDRFLALLIKVKKQDQSCQLYYLQAQVLIDLLYILQNRMAIVIQHLQNEETGEIYKSDLVSFNKEFLANIPPVNMSEIQQPNPERRIMSITLKPGDTGATLIMVLQNEQIATLHINDQQVEAMLVGIQQALKNTDDKELLEFLSKNMDYVMLYALDLTQKDNIDYQHYVHDQWKLNLFHHYLGVLYCCDADQGRKIISGAVIKTNAPHSSEAENNIIMRLIEMNPKLQAIHSGSAPCQIFSKIISSETGKMLIMEECLRPLHAFYLEMQATLEA
ncbi:MAG: YjeJ family protein [Leclercia adecarboxylata]|nr:YjeJ family protein [uncultured Leclercia sp.]MDU4840622.1 YjeJ family protein [Leclercia adecarboxylata]